MSKHDLQMTVLAERFSNDDLRAINAELAEALRDVLRDQLKTVNLHQMAPGPRARLEKARALLARLDA